MVEIIMYATLLVETFAISRFFLPFAKVNTREIVLFDLVAKVQPKNIKNGMKIKEFRQKFLHSRKFIPAKVSTRESFYQ